VRTARNITAAALAIALASLVALGPGCEEVLEVCAACDELEQGSITVSGEPRLDGTLEAAYLLWTTTSAAASSFDEEMSLLAEALGASTPAGGEFAPADAQAIADAIREQLVDAEGVTAVFEVEPGRCWIGRDLALDRQRMCEDRLNCYAPLECQDEQRGACTGVCVGDCRDGCEGECYAEASESNEECLGGCIGTCEPAEPAACAGRCSGSCSIPCSSYSSIAQCDGFCPGVCTGSCVSTLPFECVGICRGLCQVPRGEDNACAGECRGDCSNSACDGRCRGHFRPEGCDRPDRCEELYDCRETAKALAWAHLQCEGSSARVGLVFSPVFAGDRAAIVSLAEQVELTLAAVARNHALLALLVDGDDDAGEVDPVALEEIAGEDSVLPEYVDQPELLAEYSVAADRVHLPLAGLKARVAWLAEHATGGDYAVAAGPLPCVQPAFEQAHELLSGLIPVTDAASPQPDRGQGLYRVVDAQRMLLELAWPAEE
jgi:hypothetical protein